MTKSRRNVHGICILLILVLIGSAGCVTLVGHQPQGEIKSPDVSAYSQEPRSEAEVAANVKTCREWATKSTNFDPSIDVGKKWPETWWDDATEWTKKILRIETDQERWNRYYSTCMEARRYKVK